MVIGIRLKKCVLRLSRVRHIPQQVHRPQGILKRRSCSLYWPARLLSFQGCQSNLHQVSSSLLAWAGGHATLLFSSSPPSFSCKRKKLSILFSYSIPACLHRYHALFIVSFCRALSCQRSRCFRRLATKLHHSYPACQLCVKPPSSGNDGHYLDMLRRPLTLHLDGPASYGAGP